MKVLCLMLFWNVSGFNREGIEHSQGRFALGFAMLRI
jgi:hypothetical protein